MKLSKLSDQLSKLFPTARSYVRKDRDLQSVAILPQPQSRLSENILYVVSSERESELFALLPSAEDPVLNFALSGMDETRALGLHNAICLPDISATDTESALRTLFAEERALNENLMSLYHFLLVDDYLEPLMTAAHDMLKNPISILDHNLHLKVFKYERFPQPELWSKIANLKYVNYDDISPYNMQNLKDTLGEQDIVWGRSDSFRHITYAVRHQNQLFGILNMLEQDKKITNYDVTLFKAVADIITIRERMSVRANESIGSHIFDNLIQGSAPTREELTGWAAYRNWRFQPYNRIVLVSFENDDLNRNFNHIQLRAWNYFPTHFFTRIDSALAFLEESSTVPNEEFPKQLLTIFKDFHVRIGVSNVFQDLLDCRFYLDQAKKALRYNRVWEQTQRLVFYSSVQMADFFEHCISNFDYRRFLHPAILRIEEHDEQCDSEFLKTLYYYLKNDMNLAGTSKDLHLHKNSVIYRIHRIESLFDVDFNNTEETFHLLLSCFLKMTDDRLKEVNSKQQPNA